MAIQVLEVNHDKSQQYTLHRHFERLCGAQVALFT